MTNGHFQQNFSDLIHLLAECQYSFSALTTMLFIPSDPRQGNGVASPRQRYIINQIPQHRQMAFVNTHLYHYSQFTGERWVLQTIHHQCMETEYIKRNISNTYSKTQTFSSAFHPVTLSKSLNCQIKSDVITHRPQGNLRHILNNIT